MKIEEQLSILNAFKGGMQIQYKHKGGDDYYPWKDVENGHEFNFVHYQYRIKPEQAYLTYKAEELNDEFNSRVPAVKEKTTGIIYIIASIQGTDVFVLQQDGSTKRFDVCQMAELFTWSDGEIFGIKI